MRGRRGRTGRAAGAALVVAVLASVLTGCTNDENASIQIAVVWSGQELARFQAVIDEFKDETGRQVTVISTGDDIDAFLRARARAGNLPDVAVLPRPGLVRDYARRGWLVPLDSDVADPDMRIASRYQAFWRELGRARGPDGVIGLYGAWIKATHKSLFWYRRDDLTWSEDLKTWPGFLEEITALADDHSSPAPLALAAADSWVLTDWLENLLLNTTVDDPQIYDNLAEGLPCWGIREVREAFNDLANVWAIDGLFPGSGPRSAATVAFDESVVRLAIGDVVMLQGSEFVETITQGVLAPLGADLDIDIFTFPGEPAAGNGVVVGGDVAVVTSGSDGGRELVEWLTRPKSFETWMEAGGYLSPLAVFSDEDEDLLGMYPTPESQWIGWHVSQPQESTRFDLSDQLEGEVGEQIGPVLQSFLRDVVRAADAEDRRPQIRQAVDKAVTALDQAAGAGTDEDATIACVSGPPDS